MCDRLGSYNMSERDSILNKPFIPSSPPAPPPRAASCVGSTPALSPANPSWRRWRDHPRSSTCFNGVESYRFCPFHFIGFSMGKTNSSRENVLWHVYTYMYVCLQVWTWLQALYINVCLFACLGLASGLTRHYKTLNNCNSFHNVCNAMDCRMVDSVPITPLSSDEYTNITPCRFKYTKTKNYQLWPIIWP